MKTFYCWASKQLWYDIIDIDVNRPGLRRTSTSSSFWISKIINLVLGLVILNLRASKVLDGEEPCKLHLHNHSDDPSCMCFGLPQLNRFMCFQIVLLKIIDQIEIFAVTYILYLDKRAVIDKNMLNGTRNHWWKTFERPIKLKDLQFQNQQGHVIFIPYFDNVKSTAYLNFDEVHFNFIYNFVMGTWCVEVDFAIFYPKSIILSGYGVSEILSKWWLRMRLKRSRVSFKIHQWNTIFQRKTA